MHTKIMLGVPPGPVLGPMLFSTYMLPLGTILLKPNYGISFQCFVDDTQPYVLSKPDERHQVTTVHFSLNRVHLEQVDYSTYSVLWLRCVL